MQDALSMMSSDQLRAFELDDEPVQVQACYGDSRFGRGYLVAHRLVETGVRAVEVSLSGFATLLQDLSDRDLLDSTIVLCVGELGRVPQINPVAGRDHWPHWFLLCCCWWWLSSRVRRRIHSTLNSWPTASQGAKTETE